jgi:hypothetical protein
MAAEISNLIIFPFVGTVRGNGDVPVESTLAIRVSKQGVVPRTKA